MAIKRAKVAQKKVGQGGRSATLQQSGSRKMAEKIRMLPASSSSSEEENVENKTSGEASSQIEITIRRLKLQKTIRIKRCILTQSPYQNLPRMLRKERLRRRPNLSQRPLHMNSRKQRKKRWSPKMSQSKEKRIGKYRKRNSDRVV